MNSSLKKLCAINNLNTLMNYFKNNCSSVHNLELTINNPKNVNKNSIFTKTIYSIKINIRKDDLVIYKTIEDNNFDNLIKKTDNFLSSKIN
jgi:hypothetical protein